MWQQENTTLQQLTTNVTGTDRTSSGSSDHLFVITAKQCDPKHILTQNEEEIFLSSPEELL
jgi:hypothetical protein